MSKFGKALLGGIAGGAKASGEFFADRSKSKESQRKEAVIAKRQETLAKLQNEFAVTRDTTQAGRTDTRVKKRNIREDVKLKESKAYTAGLLADEQKYKTETNATEAKQKQLDALELQKQKNQGALDVASVKGLAKPDSPAVKEQARKNALTGIKSQIAGYSLMRSKDTGAYTLDLTNVKQDDVDALVKYGDSKGFQIKLDEIKGSPGMYIFSIGEFNYDSYKQSLTNPIKYENANDALFGMLKTDPSKKSVVLTEESSKALRSKVNNEQGNFETQRGPGGSVGLAAPKEISTINPALPADPKQWDVQNITQNGKSVVVVMTDNGPIELTPEELVEYKKVSAHYGGQELKGPAVDYFKEHLTGTQRIIK